MEICPKCNNPYDPEKGSCPVCSQSGKNMTDYEKDWIELTTVSNDIEYELLAGLLEMAGVPAVRKVQGVDGYLQIVLGVPLAGIQVMVPKDKYQEAMEIISTEFDEEEFLEEDDEPGKNTLN